MGSRQELEALLTNQLRLRGLARVEDRLAFVYKDQMVTLKANATIYRGRFIDVLERGHIVREFRCGDGSFDWDAIASTIVNVAERHVQSNGWNGNADSFASGLPIPCFL